MMPSESVPSSKPYRLHSSSPFFLLWGVIKVIALPLLASLTTRTIDVETAILGATLLASLFSLVQYRFYQYWLEPNEVVVKKGVLFRSVRHIPCERIQNIQVTQGPLHRLLGVAQLQLESASGSKPEAVICVISKEAADALRQHIHQITNSREIPHPELKQETQDANVLLKFFCPDILRCGLLQWHGPVLIGAVLSTALRNNPVAIEGYQHLFGMLAGYLNISSTSLWLAYIIVGGLSGLLTFCVASTLMAWFKYHNFTLKLSGQKISVSSGLLTRTQASLPTRRIQLLRLRESPMHRWLKRISVSAENAGGSEPHAQSTINLLAPVLPVGDKQLFLSRIQNDVKWQNIRWQAVEFRAWRRVAFRLALCLIAVQGTMLLWWQQPLAWLTLLLAIPLYWYAIRSVQCRGYYLDDNVIGARRGIWFRTEIFARLSKIQATSVNQTPFDRRYQMAKLVVDTAGAKLNSRSLSICYLDQKVASAVEKRIAEKISATEFVW